MKATRVISSLILAVSAGIAIGIFYAPEKGNRARRRLQQGGEDFMEDKIIDYNRLVCNVKTKLDDMLNSMTIKPSDNAHDWADQDQKTKIII